MAKDLPGDPSLYSIRLDKSDRWRVGDTRIPLERVVEQWLAGETPEQIVDSCDVLQLADVYAVISYYLQNRIPVDEYIRFMNAMGDETERMIRQAMPLRPGFKEELLARWAKREKDNAPPSQ